MRRRLTAAAAGLVARHGVEALTARRVATTAGTSTMAVYTHFGSMETLVRSVVEEGFDRLERRFVAEGRHPDPVTHVAGLTAGYVEHARENPELFAVMFGTVPMGKYRSVSSEELAAGRRGTLDRAGAALQRCVETKRIRPTPGSALSFRWWTLVHGYVMLEGAGYVAQDRGVDRVLVPLLVDFFVGEGDDERRAEASISVIFGHARSPVGAGDQANATPDARLPQ
ncbi:TetR/AcrR family transcriptional regulator [Actinokineospora xionganensis]|uniref:TetR/AcrR family transcriptional regulator n=1 Tax=Actinokineospora xionganensis TaxID=2684470 RepID=A0ABR7LCY4_9PSEU|nr:TetR/AcrR family transcriptional regulator [Actinokineospora xionganensis]MBC6450246.1 TetR/AcrR family transcriptional regulator [Actinokineospora xionganensis]